MSKKITCLVNWSFKHIIHLFVYQGWYRLRWRESSLKFDLGRCVGTRYLHLHCMLDMRLTTYRLSLAVPFTAKEVHVYNAVVGNGDEGPGMTLMKKVVK